jgi:hypothetical protein
MPFGVRNVINMFSMTMMKVLKTHMDKLLKVFINDLNVHNMSWEEHLEHLQYVFMKLTKMNLKFNLEKCEFVKFNLTFLSHVMNKDGT